MHGTKALPTALTQAERYGTPVGTALRVMAKENREMRMSEAEKKAAALPPKLTVPMIIFFLPVLFVVVGPRGPRHNRGVKVNVRDARRPAASRLPPSPSPADT